jgi:hypothetical protein
MPVQPGVNTDAMLKAGESGAAMVQHARDAQIAQQNADREHTLRTQQTIAQQIGDFEQRKEQGRSNLAREGEENRSNRMREAIAQDAQDIDMADKGLEQTGGSSRADALRKEMARGGQQTQGKTGQQGPNPEQIAEQARYMSQAEKPLEIAGPDQRTIVPTGERRQLEASKSMTNRLNAQANYINAMTNYNKAQLAGDKDLSAASLKRLEKPMSDAAALWNAGKEPGSQLTPDQWFQIEELTSDLAVSDPALAAELKSKTFGPSLQRTMANRVSQSAIQFMAVTGEMPKPELVDFSSPLMQEFTVNAGQMRDYLRASDTNGILSRSLKANTLEKRNKLIRRLTAQAMIDNGLDQGMMGAQGILPGQSGGGGVNDMPIPSQGGQGAIPAPGQQYGQPPNLKPGLTGIPPEADPNKRAGPVQDALKARESKRTRAQYFNDRFRDYPNYRKQPEQ